MAERTGSLSSGWFLKAGPALGDKDKRDTLARKLRIVAQGGRRKIDKRFFILQGTSFNYFKDENIDTYAGTIDLSKVVDIRDSQDRSLEDGFELVRSRASTSWRGRPHTLPRSRRRSRPSALFLLLLSKNRTALSGSASCCTL